MGGSGRRRATELRHEAVPNGLAAVSKVPPLSWAQILAYHAFCKISGGNPETNRDYGWKVLTSSTTRIGPEAELKVGKRPPRHDGDHRHALPGRPDGLCLGCLGLVHRLPLEVLQRQQPAYQSFAPATETGVLDPMGFWDPLGLCADKDEAT